MSIFIHGHGVRFPQPGGLTDIWQFRASVNGRFGTVSVDLPTGASESAAANAVHEILLADPSQLEGIVSTPVGGGGGGGGVGGGVASAGSGAEVEHKPPQVEEANPEE